MKTLLRTLITIISISILAACAPEPMITLSQEQISVNNKNGMQQITINTNYAWTANSNENWLKVSPNSGEAGEGRLAINFDANSEYGVRTGTITISCQDLVKTITVTQAQKEGIVLSAKDFVIDSNGGTIEVELGANVAYTYSLPKKADWIKEIDTKALNKHIHTFEIQPNYEYDSREVAIEFTNADKTITETVTIKQLRKSSLVIGQTYYRLHSDGARIELNMKTNYDFIIEIVKGSSWIDPVETKGIKNYTFYFDVLANTESEDRIGLIAIRDRETAESDTITVFQTAYSGIGSNQNSASIGYDGGELTLGFTSSADLEPINEYSWIDVKTLSAKDTVWTMNIRIEANHSPESRKAYIGVRDKNTGLVEYVEICQNGWPNILSFTFSGFEFTVPSFTGESITGEIEWGDGVIETYHEDAVHRYSAYGPHTVTITIKEASTFNLGATYGLGEIDLTRF